MPEYFTYFGTLFHRLSAFNDPSGEVAEPKDFHGILSNLPRVKRALYPGEGKLFFHHCPGFRTLIQLGRPGQSCQYRSRLAAGRHQLVKDDDCPAGP